jgi:murein L,D-transpeptidase YafK
MRPAAPRLLATALTALFTLACPRPPPPPPAPAPPAPERVEPEPPPPAPCERILRIEVHKREHRLHAFCEGGAVVGMPVALGREPEGPKRVAGDHRTPEGLYHIAGRAERSRFHRFLPIDYPSAADADTALAAGIISSSDHRRILWAHDRGTLPPGDTPLGGELGFHGEGERWEGTSSHIDWTYGCIALGDDDIDFVAARVERGTPVLILPGAPPAGGS